MKENKTTWTNMKLCEIPSSDGPIFLDIGIESNINESEQFGILYNLFRVFFRIRDSRLNSKIQMDLNYLDLSSLIKQITLISKNRETYEKALDSNYQVSIVKSSGKSFKRLILSFGRIQKNNVISIIINDRTSSVTNLKIIMNEFRFGVIFDLIKEIKSNFSVLCTNTFIISNQERQIKGFENSINNIHNEQVCLIENKKISNSDNILDNFDIVEKSENVDVEVSNIQNEFISSIDFDTPLGECFDIPTSGKTKSEKNDVFKKSINPFLKRVINYDLNTMNVLRDMFVLVNEKSRLEMFSPHTYIMSSTNTSPKIIEDITKHSNYYVGQYYILQCLKKSILSFGSGTQVNFPILYYKFPYEESTEIYNIMKCSFLCLIVFNNIVNSYSNKIENVGDVLNHFKLTREFIKITFGSFIVNFKSLLTDDSKKKKFIDDLWDLFLTFKESGAFSGIEEEYKKLIPGKYDMSFSVFEEEMNKLISFIPNIKTISCEDISDHIKEVGIDDPGKLESEEDIKNILIKLIPFEKKVEKKILDPSIIKFFDFTKDLIEDKLYEKMKFSCNTLEDIGEYIKVHNLPEEISIINMALMNNPAISKKEELDVEISKVIESNKDNEEPDWNALLFGHS